MEKRHGLWMLIRWHKEQGTDFLYATDRQKRLVDYLYKWRPSDALEAVLYRFLRSKKSLKVEHWNAAVVEFAGRVAATPGNNSVIRALQINARNKKAIEWNKDLNRVTEVRPHLRWRVNSRLERYRKYLEAKESERIERERVIRRSIYKATYERIEIDQMVRKLKRSLKDVEQHNKNDSRSPG